MAVKNAKVSVVVPIYKVPEKYLRKCIESLISQSMKEIEILLVDDGSPDDCGKICDEYAANDERIVVIHQKNKGLSGARNSGYEKATGEYLMFLDGDDFIDPQTCSIAYETAKEQNVQIVFWDIITEYENSQKENKTMTGAAKYFDREDCTQLQARVLDFKGKIAQVFAKLIKKDLLDEHNITHVEHLKQGAEGLVFNIALFEYAQSAYYLDKYLNHYIYNEQSISHSPSEENYYFVLRCFEYIEDFIKSSKNCVQLEHNLYNRLLYVVVTTGITGYFNPDNKAPYKEKVSGYKKFLKEPLINKAINNADYTGISMQRRVILLLIKLKQFWAIALLGVVRRKQLGNK